jgi:hypothetical protein
VLGRAGTNKPQRFLEISVLHHYNNNHSHYNCYITLLDELHEISNNLHLSSLTLLFIRFSTLDSHWASMLSSQSAVGAGSQSDQTRQRMKPLCNSLHLLPYMDCQECTDRRVKLHAYLTKALEAQTQTQTQTQTDNETSRRVSGVQLGSTIPDTESRDQQHEISNELQEEQVPWMKYATGMACNIGVHTECVVQAHQLILPQGIDPHPFDIDIQSRLVPDQPLLWQFCAALKFLDTAFNVCGKFGFAAHVEKNSPRNNVNPERKQLATTVDAGKIAHQFFMYGHDILRNHLRTCCSSCRPRKLSKARTVPTLQASTMVHFAMEPTIPVEQEPTRSLSMNSPQICTPAKVSPERALQSITLCPNYSASTPASHTVSKLAAASRHSSDRHVRTPSLMYHDSLASLRKSYPTSNENDSPLTTLPSVSPPPRTEKDYRKFNLERVLSSSRVHLRPTTPITKEQREENDDSAMGQLVRKL